MRPEIGHGRAIIRFLGRFRMHQASGCIVPSAATARSLPVQLVSSPPVSDNTFWVSIHSRRPSRGVMRRISKLSEERGPTQLEPTGTPHRDSPNCPTSQCLFAHPEWTMGTNSSASFPSSLSDISQSAQSGPTTTPVPTVTTAWSQPALSTARLIIVLISEVLSFISRWMMLKRGRRACLRTHDSNHFPKTIFTPGQAPRFGRGMGLALTRSHFRFEYRSRSGGSDVSRL